MKDSNLIVRQKSKAARTVLHVIKDNGFGCLARLLFDAFVGRITSDRRMRDRLKIP